MNKKLILIITILVLAILIGAFSGFPMPAKIEIAGCSADYSSYLIPDNILCQLIFFGHCPTTSFNEFNAKTTVARCLCDKLELNPSAEIENEILSLSSTMINPEKIKAYTGLSNATFICQHKEDDWLSEVFRMRVIVIV